MNRSWYRGWLSLAPATGSFQSGRSRAVERISASETIRSGDVIAIDSDHPGRFRLSHAPFSTLVAGSPPGPCIRAGENSPVGTVIGKTLGALDQGTGTLIMLANITTGGGQ